MQEVILRLMILKETLLKKIEIAATAARRDILWRRCFLPAVVATLCLFGLVLRRFPRWFELLSATFFIMMPIYFMQTFYSHHHYVVLEKYSGFPNFTEK